MQAGHLVLVLVGQELEVGSGHRLGEPAQATGRFRLGVAHPFDKGRITLGIGGVLVGGQLSDAARDGVVEARRGGFPGLALGHGSAPHGGQIVGRPPAPQEGLLVEVDGDAVEVDGALDGRLPQRHQALLPGVSHHEQVGGDGIAEDGGGQGTGVHERRRVVARGVGDGLDELPFRELHVGPSGEFGGHGLLGVDDGAGMSGAQFG